MVQGFVVILRQSHGRHLKTDKVRSDPLSMIVIQIGITFKYLHRDSPILLMLKYYSNTVC